MKLLADENVARGIIKALRAAGFDTATIPPDRIGASDRDILRLATELGRATLTMNSDFGTMAFRDGLSAPFGIVYCRMKPTLGDAASARLAAVLSTLDDLTDKIVVIDDKRHRLRALPPSGTRG